MPLRIILGRAANRETPDTRTTCISDAHPAVSGAHDSPVMRSQDATQHAGQMLAPLGVAAQPEKMLGGAAGQIAADSAMQLDGQIARAPQA